MNAGNLIGGIGLTLTIVICLGTPVIAVLFAPIILYFLLLTFNQDQPKRR